MGRADQQLRLIAEIVQVAGALEVEVWLRGGWAMDFFLGEVTRDHEDIDWFAWTDNAGALAEGLLLHGYQPIPGPPPDLQLDFAKDGLDNSFTFLDRDMAGRVVVAGGPWAGAPWPEGMLDAGPYGWAAMCDRQSAGPDRDQADDADLGSLPASTDQGRRGYRPAGGGPPGMGQLV
ncbi:nucleotidyltransferase domain-containing protein [Streptomyces sp. NBC_00354]|uniref:nucleotidyltransferase domain-containing protein n=1 Tax=Streptomyces sp. NBC_00354 TaxID=2975723 RepID=UPI002E257473